MPNRHGASDGYRYGFQGQEKDDEVKGVPGSSINYKYRMHDPRVGRFFAVDPLFKRYPHYSPYSFSGNKVIQFVELEGLEEGRNHYEFNPYDYGVAADQQANSIIDGIGNLIIGTANIFTSDETEGELIRKMLIRDHKLEIPSSVTNEQLGENFNFKKRNRDVVVEPDKGVLSELLDYTLSAVDGIGIYPGKNGVFMFAKTGVTLRSSLTDLIRRLDIKNRANRISEFLDPDTGKLLRPHEVQSAAAFEEVIGGTVKQSEINGADILASGSLGGVVFANRKISIIGKPMNLNQTIEKFTEWLGSLNDHLKHSDVYTLVDLRHFSDERKALIKGLIDSKSKEIRESVIIME